MKIDTSYVYRKLWGIKDSVKADLRKVGDHLQFITPIFVIVYGIMSGDIRLLQVFFYYYLGCTVIHVLLKWLFNNPRPSEIDTDINPQLQFQWSVNKGDSFPSGHTMSAVSGGVFWFNICPYLGVIGIILGIFTAFTRIVVRAHWLRDVGTSSVIAIAMWGITDYYFLNGTGLINLYKLFLP